MKKLLSGILAVVLLLGLMATAYADPIVKYVLEDQVNVYAAKNTSAEVLKKLTKGEKLLIETVEEEWCSLLVESKDGNGQTLGWVQSKYLADVPPCDHTWGDWTVYQNPTCTAVGYRSHTCTKCGKSESETIAMLPHAFGDWSVLRNPTCTEEGIRAHWCRVCGFEETQQIQKLPHRYGDWAITLEATDHSAGRKTKTCLDCGHEHSEYFDPEGTLRVSARGDAVREIQELLAEMGYLKSRDIDGLFGPGLEKAITKFQKDLGLNPDGVAWPQTIKLLHHDFGEWEILSTATRFAEGERVRVCKDCGYEQRKTVEAGLSFVYEQVDSSVKTIQTMLNDLGFSAGSADGAYGPKLDSAFKAFALEHDIDAEVKRLRPGDVDALVNAWIEALPEEGRMLEGGKGSPVNLILTVKETGKSDEGVYSFDWTLSNAGSESARFLTVLMGYGGEHDFTGDNVVVVVDNTSVKADGNKTLSGSFRVVEEWNEDGGPLCFCAVATDKQGAAWISNVVTFEA